MSPPAFVCDDRQGAGPLRRERRAVVPAECGVQRAPGGSVSWVEAAEQRWVEGGR